MKQLFFPSDYPLSNLFYFSSRNLLNLTKKTNKAKIFLKRWGFEECHLPFLVPKSILLLYGNSISLNDFIKAYSGKDRRSYMYLRPYGIFSQGIVLAKNIIRSYRNLPLKLFEISPGYLARRTTSTGNIFTSPEQSFSIQSAIFTENPDELDNCNKLITSILNKFSIDYLIKNSNHSKKKFVQYFYLYQGQNIELARIHVFGKEISKKANIYFFDRLGKQSFPYLYTFAISQNIFLLGKHLNSRKEEQKV